MAAGLWGTSCCALGTVWSGWGGMRSSTSSICGGGIAGAAGGGGGWDFWGGGAWGRGTMEFVEEAARLAGIRALHLEVVRENVAALQVYQKLGFAEHDSTFLSKWIAPDFSKPQGRNGH